MENIITSAYKPKPHQYIIAREGHPFIAIALTVAFILYFIGTTVGVIIMLALTAFIVYFFRNPNRTTPKEPGLVIAPADGRIIDVNEGVQAPYTGKKSTKISTFMSVFNVHINRFPVSSRVQRSVYHQGKFFVASLDKASDHNERNGLVLADNDGREYVMVQIAGLVARRIVCYLKEGERLERGERFGLIRFGSRVDLYLPPEIKIAVKVGDKVKAGETVFGRIS